MVRYIYAVAAVAIKSVACGRSRAVLSLQVLRRGRPVKADVGAGNKNVRGLQSHNRLGREKLVVGPTRKICGIAAGAGSDRQDDNTCGIHTLTVYAYAGCLNCILAAASPLSVTNQ